ncbi:MAG: hypothetical protein ACXVIL_09445 [Halobacteriota archaeon]
MSTLALQFTREDVAGYLELRSAGLTRATIPWLRKAAELLWNATGGVVSVATTRRLRDHAIHKYKDTDAKRKVLNFAKAFLRYKAKTTFDSRYAAFDLFLALPKAVKVRKHVTHRIVTTDDIRNVITAIRNANLPERHRLNFEALVLFGAYTGQRPYATIRQLTAVQFHQALEITKPVLDVRAEQDKIRMEHYVPLHPSVVEAVETCDPSRAGLQFAFESFRRWTKEAAIPLTRCASTFVPSDLRKFAEQHGDVIGWDHSNRAYILTHCVSGVDWVHYKHPLPEHVYDVYMHYWGNVRLA